MSDDTTDNTSGRQYAVVTTKFHGGGIEFETSSPREAYRYRRANHDGCNNGSGCEGFAFSEDGGETWYTCEIYHGVEYNRSDAKRHDYADGAYIVDTMPSPRELKPASDEQAAGALAL